MRTMKAIRVSELGGPDVLKLTQVPIPSPGPGQVLVRLRAIGVNPVETYVRSGAHGRKPTLPYTPGTDGAGSVEEVGAEVTTFRTGERVYVAGSISGTYADAVLCEAAQVHPLPERISFAQGAALGIPYATAWRALLQRGEARSGETVLVRGASGGVGTAAVQIARERGLRVLGTAGTEPGRALVREQGADAVFDHHAPDCVDRIREATGGRGVDLIVEMLANANLASDLTLLAPRGRVVVVGSRGPIEIDPRETMNRDADIRGMLLFNATPAELAAIHVALVAGLENGTLRPVVGRTLPLAEAPEAHRAILAGGAAGKLVLVP